MAIIFNIIRRLLPLAAGALLWMRAAPALANGRFPGADQLVVDPRDPDHLLVRATFGFVESRDRGASWQWICENVVGRIGTADPPIALTSEGAIVVGVPFDGVSVSRDQGCSWSRAPAPLTEQLAVDLTVDPIDPANLLVLISTFDPTSDVDAAIEFVTRVVETKDGARTWKELGAALPSDFIATTIEVAPSDRDRIYVGGVVGQPPSAALERSDDRGLTWTRSMVGGMASTSAYLSAVDPIDADRLWVRVASNDRDAFGMSPTSLMLSDDRGATFRQLAQTKGSMLGFALSPDGSRVAYGAQDDGVFVGPSGGSDPYPRVSRLINRCLTWTKEGLYACGTEPIDAFAVGRMRDVGSSFEPVYRLADTCPRACAVDGPFNATCRAAWAEPLTGVATVIGASGATCSVPWARVLGDGGNADDAGAARDAGASGDAGTNATIDASGGCSCRTLRHDARAFAGTRDAFIASAFGLLVLGRRRRRTQRPMPKTARNQTLPYGCPTSKPEEKWSRRR